MEGERGGGGSAMCWEGVARGWREEFPRPRSRNGEGDTPPTTGLHSLEYWDYSVELECLSGPEGIQRKFQ